MLRKLLFFSVLMANAAFANSMGWPAREELPEWLSVDIDIPARWGSPLAVNLYSSFRIKITNKRDSEVHILNMRFVEPRFLLIKKDGSSVTLSVPIAKLRAPESNPSLILGRRSEIGFEIEFERPANPASTMEGDVVFEVKVVFVAGDIVERREADGRINPDVGWLEGFDYTITRRLGVAQRLLK